MNSHRGDRVPSDYIEPEEEEGCLLNLSNDEDEWAKNSPAEQRYPSPNALRNDPRMPKPFHKTKLGLCTIITVPTLFILGIFFMYRNTIWIASLRQRGIPPGLYSRDGVLYVGKNTPFHIKGFSWYGMEEEQRMPGGLKLVTADDIFAFARKYRFNAIRLPLSVENIVNNEMGLANTFKNPELTGLTYLEIVKVLIRKAAENNILILLDAHRLQSHEVQSKGLWYTDEVHEERLFLIWKTLCDEMKDEWNVMGADIYNEPWDALWNTSDKSQDWKQAAERLGNLVQKSCPSWLVLVEGVGKRAGRTSSNPFWAENLRAIQDSPPRLKLKSKVALSPHVYGPSVYNQTYFKGDDFAKKMPAIWDDHFGKASEKTGLATIIGEWGGWYYGKDKEWQQAFMKYILDKSIPFFYWCLNPESADTGGLLMDDWVTPREDRLELLDAAPSTRVADHAVHFRHWRSWRV